MTWSPLAGGFLTGKYEDGVPLYSRASMKVRFIDVLQFVFLLFFCILLSNSLNETKQADFYSLIQTLLLLILKQFV